MLTETGLNDQGLEFVISDGGDVTKSKSRTINIEYKETHKSTGNIVMNKSKDINYVNECESTQFTTPLTVVATIEHFVGITDLIQTDLSAMFEDSVSLASENKDLCAPARAYSIAADTLSNFDAVNFTQNGILETKIKESVIDSADLIKDVTVTIAI